MAGTSGYNGNPLLVGANVQRDWTADQIIEWAKCKNDPIYFIEKYIKIITLDHGLQPMKLYNFQKEIILKIVNNNKLISACARQMGKTTVMAALFCWYILFHEGKTCAILANKAATAREILSRVQKAYEYLPKWLQQGVTEWNKGSFALENDSRILAASTSSSAIRGYTINFLFLDEFAFVPNNLAEEFFTSVYPTISSGETSKIVMISTPNGMNHFYKYWMEALDHANGFEYVKAIWSDIPTRTQKWADGQRAVLGDTKFAQEMEVEFIGASNTLISGSKLKGIPIKKPIMETKDLRVYEKPIPGKAYVITVDTSRGVGLDYSAFVIFDVTQLPYNIVARYRNNTISSMLYPGLIHKMAMEYNEAAVLVETNDVGEGVANSLFYDFEYELTLAAKGDSVSSWGGKGTKPGIRTTTKTKRVGCDILKQLVENDKITINDYDVLFELSNFVAKGRSYEADVGNDDLAMCLVMLAYLTTQPSMADLSQASLKQTIVEEKMKMAEEEMIPLGLFSVTDGTDTPDELRFSF